MLLNSNKLKRGRLQLKFFTIQKGRFLLNMYGKITVETTERIKRMKKLQISKERGKYNRTGPY